ncbi:MAG: molybdopterin molybdotransferase MoeA [Pseudomonadota bacterium]
MSGLISVDEALDRIMAARPALGVEHALLADALGATLAEPVAAKVSRPSAAVSAMDGYAVRLEDVRKPEARLRIIGEAPAGRPFDGRVEAGETVRIFTGGEVPEGADHIVVQEDVARDGDYITCAHGHEAARHVRVAGLDFCAGAPLLASGTRIGAGEIAIAAAANHDRLPIRKRPTIALLANGDELRPPGSDLGPGELVSSNSAGLGALARSWGGAPIDLGIASDSVAAIRERIDQAEGAEIILPVGGASVGDHDHMRAAFAEAGFETVFAGVAVKPGKPTWFARKGNQRVLGLPGNPASAFVCAHLFLPALMGVADGLQTRRARLAEELPANGARESFLRAQISFDAEARLVARAPDNQDSSLIHPFLDCGGLIRRAANAPPAAAGEPVELVLIRSL